MPTTWIARSLVLVGCCFVAAVGAVLASAPYARQPGLHGERVVFCAEGDLWQVAAGGGMARRLTRHIGTESAPQISPDGKLIAFAATYDGNNDLFVIDIDGGEPRRLTWSPAQDEPVGWMPDGKTVIFRSNGEDPLGNNELFTIPAAGGDAVKLPLGWAERLAVDPISGVWAFNRSAWEQATWKRYRGGTAPTIWVGDPARRDFKQVTAFTGPNSYPMWFGGRIYYLCDKGGSANLWSMRPDGSDSQRLTSFDSWDVRWPAMAPDGRIVFVLAADIFIYDPATKSTRKLDVQLPSDLALTRSRYTDAAKNLTALDISPDGSRLVITTRGELFSVAVKNGVTLPITGGTGTRESSASFSGDGERIVYISDATGEEEIRSRDAWGRGEETVLVKAGSSGWHFAPLLSQGGKWVAWADQTQTLYVAGLPSGEAKIVDHSSEAEIREYVWSADGRWLAYTKSLPNEYRSIFVYDTTTGVSTRVTSETTDDHSPAWDPEGRYLYFASDRAINPILGTQDWDNVEAKNTKLFMVILRNDLPNPLANLAGLPPSGAEQKAASDPKDKSKNGKSPVKQRSSKKAGKSTDAKADEDDEAVSPKPVTIDLTGVEERIVELPIAVGNYSALLATSKTLFYLSSPTIGFAEMPGLFQAAEPNTTLMAFDMEQRKATEFAAGIGGVALAAQGSKLALAKQDGIYVVGTEAPPGDDLSASAVDLSGAVVEVDPREEWRQMFHEAWRHERDFFWDAGMGGLDWKKIGDQYATLLPRLATRGDLRDLLGELIGELNNSHTYVWGGDAGVEVPSTPTGLLGAELVREAGVYRVTRIYRGDPADNVVSPLLAPGVRVKEGDYILAVNHRSFDARRPFHAAFEGAAGGDLVLTINDKPLPAGARDVVVRTLADDQRLRYVDWVRRNREYVARKSGGTIGYVHIPDMWQAGLIAFNTWFYPQLDRQGMVIDVRWNGGGAVSQMILSRLRRHVLSFDRARGGNISTYPNKVLNGPFVVLTNEFAGSDGDIFPAAVQLEKLAPVIGMRSWGGVVGIRGDRSLSDGGVLTQPEFAWWDPQQGWDLENRGVIPDIELQNLPQELAQGIDAQLDRAIAEVLSRKQQHPPIAPQFGPVRKRTREAFQQELR